MVLADSPRRFAGLYLHIALCVGAALLMNGLIFGLGWGRGAAAAQPWFAPSGYVVGAVWLGLFAAMAAARWHLATRAGAAAASARLGVDALIAFCLVWPLYALAGDSLWAGLIGNAGAIALALYAMVRSAPASRTAAALLLPVPLWVGFASLIIAAQLTTP